MTTDGHEPLDDEATDGDRELARFAEGHDSVFRLVDARRKGLTERQIRRRAATEWVRLHEGIFRMPGAAPSWRSDLRAATWAGGEDAAISHRCAAALYEVPGARRDPIEITCRRWERARFPGLVVHEGRRWTSAEVSELDGIPVVTPEFLVLQLPAWKPHPNYVEAVIHALRRQRLIGYESMHETFVRHARRGLKGVAATRVALERWDPSNAPTASEMETWLVQTLRAHDLPEPVLQYDVYDDNGLWVARADAGLPQWRITIEYESMQEHLDEFQIAKDARRRNRVLAAGYFPLTARYNDLRSGGHELVEEIRAVSRRSA
jgi:hypothetical protein